MTVGFSPEFWPIHCKGSIAASAHENTSLTPAVIDLVSLL